MDNIKNCGPSIAEKDIVDIERKLGASLPLEFRKFLKEKNGGRPTPDVIDIPGLSDSPTDVQVLFGVGRSSKTSCIEWNLETLVERIEKEILPIACDSIGNIFCLSVRQDDFGNIIYYDLAEVFGDFESKPKCYAVASNFESFLGKLRDLE